MNPQSRVISGCRNPQLCLDRRTRSLHDPRVAQVEPIAGVEVLAVVDDDLQPFNVGNFELNRLGRLVAGDFGFEQHAVVAED